MLKYSDYEEQKLQDVSGQKIVEVAINEIGNSDKDCPDGRYHAGGSQWCSEFVSWVYNEAGYSFTGGEEGGWLYHSANRIVKWFKNTSGMKYISRESSKWSSIKPKPGDYVLIGRAGGMLIENIVELLNM